MEKRISYGTSYRFLLGLRRPGIINGLVESLEKEFPHLGIRVHKSLDEHGKTMHAHIDTPNNVLNGSIMTYYYGQHLRDTGIDAWFYYETSKGSEQEYKRISDLVGRKICGSCY